MVTQEERARMRREIQDDCNVVHYKMTPGHMLELLDTIDAVEGKASVLFDEAVGQKKRAILAEAERDALAQALWERGHIMGDICAVDLSAGWLEWARREATREEEA